MTDNLNKQQKIALFTLLAVILIDSLGMGLIYPIFPDLFIGGSQGLFPHALAPFWQNFYYGVAFVGFQLGSFFGVPCFGDLSDHYGRKPILVVGLWGLVASYALCAIAVTTHHYWLFILARFTSGVCAGTISIAQAVIADLHKGTSAKIKGFGLPVIAYLLGFIAGPLIALATVGNFSSTALHLARPFWIPALLALINVLFLHLFFHETYQPTAKKSSLREGLLAVRFIFEDARVRWLGLLYLAYQIGYNNYMQSISMVAREQLKISTAGLDALYITVALAMIVAVILINILTNRKINLIKGVKIYLILLGGSITLAGSFFILSLQWILAACIFTIALFLMVSVMAIASNTVGSDEQGKVMGALGSLNALAGVISAVVVSILLGISAHVLLIISGISILIALVLPFPKVDTLKQDL